MRRYLMAMEIGAMGVPELRSLVKFIDTFITYRHKMFGRFAEMPLRDMDINGGLLQIAVAEQNLNGAQVGAGLQQMGGKAVTKDMQMKRFANPGAPGGRTAGVPDDLAGNRVIGGGIVDGMRVTS